MKTNGWAALACLMVAASPLCMNAQRPPAKAAAPKADSASAATYVPVRDYDPARDAARDIDEAVAEARRTGKRVLVEVGGKWCSWCHTMHRFYEENRELLELREKNYINVVVNFSPENQNEKALSRYPKIEGYPHLFVLDANGKLLRSQNTSELEEGESYNLKRFMAFLNQWAPGGPHKSR